MTLFPKRHLHLVVEEQYAGLRLDRYLAEVCTDIGRQSWKKIVAVGGVHLDGRRWSRCSTPLRPGCRVDVYIDGRPLEPWLPDDEQVLYRDRWLLALNKPRGIDCQPTPSRFQGTVYQGVLDFLGRRDRRQGRKPDIGMVQRLDRDTSGVMVFSIHPQAHPALTRQFSGHLVRKFYLALVQGAPPNRAGTIRSHLSRIRATNLVRSVDKGGKEAITRFRLLGQGLGLSLVLAEPVTGRSHQIRAHFAEAGMPLLGDVAYGGPEIEGELRGRGHWLHAWQLLLHHPVSGTPLRLVAGLPEEWQAVMADGGLCLPADMFPERLLGCDDLHCLDKEC